MKLSFKKLFKFVLAILSFIFFCFFNLNFVVASNEWWENNCVQLNTNIPGIWNKICMWKWDEKNTTYVTTDDAFPKLMWALMKIVVAVIIAVGFIMIILGGLLITSSWADQSRYWRWKDMIIKVIIWIALLWLSWVILHMINPNFFK